MLKADQSGTFKIGGDLEVCRLGFGAMRLTGPGVWGPPQDEANAMAVLRRAVELGIDFIDTADVYGPGDNERLICKALKPYSPRLIIATKGGMVRSGPATRDNPGMSTDGSETHIRQAVMGSLRDLGVERIALYQLHRVDPATPIEQTMRVFRALQKEGKIRHVGLSEVTIPQIKKAQSVVKIATVQNNYNLADRKHADVVSYCKEQGIGFIPFYPQNVGAWENSAVMKKIVSRTSATPRQIALAWLLKKSSVILPIPGTSSLTHMEETVAACNVELSPADMEEFERPPSATPT